MQPADTASALASASSSFVSPPDVFEPFKAEVGSLLTPFTGIDGAKLASLLETPPDRVANGDFALPLMRLNSFKKEPGFKAIPKADEVVAAFKPTELITGCKAAGTYVNFFLNKTAFIQRTVATVFAAQECWGRSNVGNGKTVVVEYSSPNIAKPFHAGHLRSTIIGNFIANVYDMLNYKTVRINYLGDWGKQYGILALGFKKYGSEEELVKRPIRHLFEIYVKINADISAEKGSDEKNPLPSATENLARDYFKKMEDGDEESLGLWKRFRQLSIDEYTKMYERLNVRFDVYSGESEYQELMKKELEVLREKKLLEESQGAQVVDLGKKLGKVIVVKKDGATLYITRDIAAAAHRQALYSPEKLFYIVAAQQDLHFKQLFEVLAKMDYKWATNAVHVNFGMVKGMSTRRGNVQFLDEILEDAKNTMMETMKKNEKKFAEIENPDLVADVVGMAAVMIQDYSANRIKDYDWDMKRVCQIEGDTGPYLMFAYARLASMERKAAEAGFVLSPSADLSLLVEPEAFDLLDRVARFPSVVLSAQAKLEPCVVVAYLFGLSHALSSALDKLWVMGREKPLAEARLVLYHLVRVTLGNGLRLLSLRPMDRI